MASPFPAAPTEGAGSYGTPAPATPYGPSTAAASEAYGQGTTEQDRYKLTHSPMTRHFLT